MNQSKAMSFIEAFVSTFFAFIVSIIVQLIVFKMYDIEVTAAENVSIVCIFTGVSVVRGFISRRIFNWVGERPIVFIRSKVKWILK